MTILLPTTHIDHLNRDVGVFVTEQWWVSNITDADGVWHVKEIIALSVSGGSHRA